MAEAFAKKHGMNARSAGTIPSARINPTVADAMRERGIDISSNQPKILTPELIRDALLVVTMGCSIEEACPRPIVAQMQKKLIEWHLEDPKGKPLDGVRKIRDEIESRSQSFPSQKRFFALCLAEIPCTNLGMRCYQSTSEMVTSVSSLFEHSIETTNN